jgi:putative transposase
MKFGFLAKHRGVWPVRLMLCEALGVFRGGFYACIRRPKSRREQPDEATTPHVYQSFVASDRTYGARRVVDSPSSVTRLK